MHRHCVFRDEWISSYIASGRVVVNAAAKNLRMSILSVRLITCLTYCLMEIVTMK